MLEIREPRYEMLPLDVLRVDVHLSENSYQRDPTKPHFRKMKREIIDNYDPAMMHALDVSLWDNYGEGPQYWVYDGFCRLESARALHAEGRHDDTIMCRVIQVSQQDQADLFGRQTARRTVGWVDLHPARLVSKHPSAIAVDEVVAKLNVTLGPAPADVRAVKACYSTIEYDRCAASPDAPLRPELLHDVLWVAGTAWTDDLSGNITAGLRKQYASSDRMINALAVLLATYDQTELPRDDLATALGHLHPRFIVTEHTSKTSVHGSNNKYGLARALANIYNDWEREQYLNPPDGVPRKRRRVDVRRIDPRRR